MDEQLKRQKFMEESMFHTENRKRDWSGKQQQSARSMNNLLHGDSVLTTVHTQQMTDEQMESAYKQEYFNKLNTKNAREGTREMKNLKKQSKTKAKNAVALHKKLMELADDGTDYEAMLENDFELCKIRLHKYIVNKKNPASVENGKKISAIKKSARSVCERGLKLYHAYQTLEKEKDNYPELYNFAYESYMQTQKEWEYIKDVSEKTFTYQVKINEDVQREYLEDRGKVQGFEREVDLDTSEEGADKYEEEFRENMKKKKVDWTKDDGSDGVAPAVKQKLREGIARIQNEFPGVTEDQIESTVNEYLKRLVANTEFRARMKMSSAAHVLNRRYHSKADRDDYMKLVHKQYSKSTNHKNQNCIGFGSLGGLTAKDYLCYGENVDINQGYGNLSFRMDKDALKGHISFVSGASAHHYDHKYGRSAFVDDVNGEAPDITLCGDNLPAIYKRAKELEEKNWEGMKSSEQEAKYTTTDHAEHPYFECCFHGNVGPAQIVEATYILSSKDFDLRKMDSVREALNNQEFKDLYERIKVINNNPGAYGREGKPELMLTVWDLRGNQLSYNDVKSILG